MPIPDPSVSQLVLRLPQPVAQAIVDYLVTKPFGEVYELIMAIQKLEKIDPTQPK